MTIYFASKRLKAHPNGIIGFVPFFCSWYPLTDILNCLFGAKMNRFYLFFENRSMKIEILNTNS